MQQSYHDCPGCQCVKADEGKRLRTFVNGKEITETITLSICGIYNVTYLEVDDEEQGF
jgi:hypothetical protein